MTRSGWRLSVVCREGNGAIVLVETGRPGGLVRGEGVFLGLPRKRLEAAYRALLPRSDRPEFSLPQLG